MEAAAGVAARSKEASRSAKRHSSVGKRHSSALCASSGVRLSTPAGSALPRVEAGPLGAPPLPRLLERAASRVADVTTFGHAGVGGAAHLPGGGGGTRRGGCSFPPDGVRQRRLYCLRRGLGHACPPGATPYFTKGKRDGHVRWRQGAQTETQEKKVHEGPFLHPTDCETASNWAQTAGTELRSLGHGRTPKRSVSSAKLSTARLRSDHCRATAARTESPPASTQPVCARLR